MNSAGEPLSGANNLELHRFYGELV